MDAFFFTALVIACAAVVAGLCPNSHNHQPKDEIMAAIDRLKTAVAALQTNAGEVSTAVNRIVAVVEDLRAGNSPEIDAATASIEGVNGLLLTLSNQLQVAAGPPQQP